MNNRGLRGKLVAGALSAACAVALAFAAVPLFGPSFGQVAADGSSDDGGIVEVAEEDVPSGLGQRTSGADSSMRASNWDGSAEGGANGNSAEGLDGEASGIVGEYEPDVVLVQLPAGWTVDELNDALASADCVQVPAIDEEDLQRGFAALPLSEGYDVSQAMAELNRLPAVVEAQPNYLYTLADDGLGNSDDLAAGSAVGLTDGAQPLVSSLVAQLTEIDDTRKADQWALGSVHAYEAWDIVKAGAAGDARVSVAVLDNGCLVTHEDLEANVVASYNAVSTSSSFGTSDVTPSFGSHGTHVCGIVSAVVNNGKGVAGVSYNAGLVPVQVFHQSTEGAVASTTSLCNAYQYVMDNADKHNIKVVNMSLGGVMNASATLSHQDGLLISAVNSAYNKGILTVCSAGNDAGASKQNGPYYNYPSDWLDNAIGVIALKSGEPPTRDSYSNYNVAGQTTKDIAAPGTSVLSTISTSTGSYGWMDGTSMASPCVAGIAALVYATNPALSAADVSDILCSTATDLGASGWDEEYGAGEVNAYAAAQVATSAFLTGNPVLLKGSTTKLVPSKEDAWEWSTSDANVAAVSSAGVVTGVGAGKATITATSGSVAISKEVTVYDISFTGASEVNVGSTVKLTFNEKPDTELWYVESSDTKIAQIVESDADDNNVIAVQGVSAGSTTITATSASNSKMVVKYDMTVIDLDGESSVLKGKTTTLTPTVSDDWRWTSADAGIATVSSSGVVTGVSSGSTTITAASKTRSLSKTVTVYDASLDGDDEVKAGSSITLALSAAPSGASWSFSSSDTALASVSDKGDGTVVVTGLSAGEVEIVATLDGAEGVSVSHSVAVLASDARFSLRESRVSITFPDYGSSYYYYSGQAKEPEPTVTYASGTGRNATRTVLVKGEDYIVTYDDNTDAGTAYVRITGTGDYKDTVSYKFTINQYPVRGAYSTFFFFSTTIVPAVSYSGVGSSVYTGRAQTPKPLLTINTEGSYTLKEGVDYSLSYSDNKDAGTATITVTGKGNFSDSGTISFAIEPASLSGAAVSAAGWTWDGKVHDPGVGVKLDGVSVAQDGNWSYALAKDGRAYSAGSVLGAGTYTVTVTGEGNYADSATTTFTVRRSIKGATVQLSPTSYTYDGTAKRPTVAKVTLSDGTVLSSGDYTVSYADNTAVGTATATVTGKNGYFDSASASFQIVKPAEADSGQGSSSGSGGNASAGSKQGSGSGGDAGSGRDSDSGGNADSGQDSSSGVGSSAGTASGSDPSADSARDDASGPDADGSSQEALVPVPAASEQAALKQAMYRLYNPYTGEHFYTASITECNEVILAGWSYEGIGWTAPAAGDAVFRVYNAYSGEHHYTLDADERDALVAAGWDDEGVGWYSDPARAVPLYREYNPYMFACNHNYTASKDEHDMLVSLGWSDEGEAWYGCA